ncbi:hypothetical protein [Gynuella sp.]|uniref:hypothetical protein n=1 Tax=Gynuella sp. TaxID=2969146 RepID=UPI003D0B1E34
MAIQSNQSLVWRLLSDSDFTPAKVAFVIPEGDVGFRDITLETGIHVGATSRSQKFNSDELQWSENDFQLLLALLERMFDGPDEVVDGEVSIDLTDPSIVEVISIVASARFNKSQDLSSHHFGDPIFTHYNEVEVGDLMTFRVGDQFHLVVIVELDAVQATCVCLEDVGWVSEDESVGLHDLITISRMDLLPASFGPVFPRTDDVLH